MTNETELYDRLNEQAKTIARLMDENENLFKSNVDLHAALAEKNEELRDISDARKSLEAVNLDFLRQRAVNYVQSSKEGDSYTCLWCGTIIYGGKEAVAEHMLHCDLNPITKELQRVEGLLNAATHGCSWVCDFCGGSTHSHEDSRKHSLSCPSNPLVQEITSLKQKRSFVICHWCGKILSKEDAAKHVMNCPSNPMVEKLRVITQENKTLRNMLCNMMTENAELLFGIPLLKMVVVTE